MFDINAYNTVALIVDHCLVDRERTADVATRAADSIPVHGPGSHGLRRAPGVRGRKPTTESSR